jgi:dTDP-4-amino-4,6-dideoxygalactose transaminase
MLRKITSANRPIPVLRPLLPKAAKLLPYLKRIDESRVYSNWGPLVTELSERLSTLFSVRRDGVVLANSGMSALIGAILASAGRAKPARPLALVPEYTFTATALAAEFCGYEVVLCGCHARTWTFSPEELMAHPEVLARVGLIVPVAPFGRAVGQAEWVKFQQQTGIPVAIDGAACFEALLSPASDALGPIPVALSFHATKSFGTGEGGCVVTADSGLAALALQHLNFGFFDSRNSRVCGINGKMSEYSAAIGLAELDGWAFKSRRQARMVRTYVDTFTAAGITQKLWSGPEISSSYVLLECSSARQSTAVVGALAADRIDTRLWYGTGLGEHDNFKESAHLNLHGAAALDPRTLVGLPVAADLKQGDIERICSRLVPVLGLPAQADATRRVA